MSKIHFLALFFASLCASQEIWSEIAPSGLVPTGRESCSCEFFSAHLSLVAFGGGNGESVFNDTWIFSFATNRWKPWFTEIYPIARKMAPLRKLSETTAILFGGLSIQTDGTYHALQDTWLFSITDGWALAQLSSSSNPEPRYGHSAVSLADNSVLIFGGIGLDSNRNQFLFNNIWRVSKTNVTGSNNLVWNSVTIQRNADGAVLSPDGRYGHSAEIIGSKMFVFGGKALTGVVDDLWVFDTSNFTWTILTTPLVPDARSFHGSCVMGLNIIIQGGETSDATQLASDTWRYDSFNNKWNLLAQITTPTFVAKHTMTSVDSSACLLFGGLAADSSNSPRAALQSIMSHPTDAKWAVVAPERSYFESPAPREMFAATLYVDTVTITTPAAGIPPPTTAQYTEDKLIVLGGILENGTVTDEIWLFDVFDFSWESVSLSDESKAAGPGPHYGARAIANYHYVVLCGGSLPGSSIWALNRNVMQWRQIVPVTPTNIFQRNFHQINLWGRYLIVDGGKTATGKVLDDIVRVDLAPLIDGNTKPCLHFNGNGQFVQLGYNLLFQPSPTGGVAIEATFLIEDASRDISVILSFSADATSTVAIFVEQPSGNVCFGPHLYHAGLYVTCGNTRVDDDRWHHVMVTYEGDGVGGSLYVDGKLDLRSTDLRANLDFTVPITTFLAGGLTYPKNQITFQSPTGNIYRKFNSKQFFPGYIDSVRLWDFAATPAKLGYFSDGVRFPDWSTINHTSLIGSWSFVTISDSGTTPNDNPVGEPAILGNGNSESSRPVLLPFDAPRNAGAVLTWKVQSPIIVNSNSSVSIPRYSHASTIHGKILFIFGGRNETHVNDGLWSLNLITGEMSLVPISIPSGQVGSNMVASVSADSGRVLLLFGGRGVAGSKASRIDLSSSNSNATFIQLDENSYTTSTINVNLNLRVEIENSFAGLLSNSSMVLMFGGSFKGESESPQPRTLSNRLFFYNLANPGSSVQSLHSIGLRPITRLVQPFAVISNEVAVAFTGKMSDRVWTFNSEVGSWGYLEPHPHPNVSEPGFALLYDNSRYYFIGHHCSRYDWRTVATDENCRISNRIYVADTQKKEWSTTSQSQSPPSSISLNTAQGGILDLFPDFCAYDGSTEKCSDGFLDPKRAVADGQSLDDHDLSVAEGLDGELLAVWVAGTAILSSTFSPMAASWSPTVTIWDDGSSTVSKPAAAYVAASKTWVVVFSSNSNIRSSGTDSDLLITRNPYPNTASPCTVDGKATLYSALGWGVSDTAVRSAFFSFEGPADSQFIAVFAHAAGNYLKYLGGPNAEGITIPTAGVGDSVDMTGISSTQDVILIWTEHLGAVEHLTSPYFPKITPENRFLRSANLAEKDVMISFTSLVKPMPFWWTSPGYSTCTPQSIFENSYFATIYATYPTDSCNGEGNSRCVLGADGLTVCTWSIKNSASMRYQLWLRSFDIASFSSTNQISFAIYDGPNPGYHPVITDSYDIRASYCRDTEFKTGPHLSQPNTPSMCTFITTSSAFSVVLTYESHMDAPFAVSYRYIPSFPLSQFATTDIANDTSPVISGRDNVKLVVWSSNRVSANGTSVADYDIWYTRSVNNGTIFSDSKPIDPASLTDHGVDDTAPKISWSVAPASHVVVVVWSAQSTSTSSIRIATSADDGVTWTPATSIASIDFATTGIMFSNPSIAHNGDAWIAVWEARGAFGSDLDLVFARNTGAQPSQGWSSWSAVLPSYAHRDLGDDRHPSIGSVQGNFLISFDSNSNFNGMLGESFNILNTMSGDGGLSWRTPFRIGRDLVISTDLMSKSEHSWPRVYTYQVGALSFFGVGFVFDTVAALGYFPSSISEQCPMVSSWSTPRLLDDLFSTTDVGLDENPKLAVSDNTVMCVWATTNTANAETFPVSGLVSRYLMQSFENVSVPLFPEFYPVPAIKIKDETGFSNLLAFNDQSNVYSTNAAESPIVYPSLKMDPSVFLNEYSGRCINSGLIQTFPGNAMSVSVWLKNKNARSGTIFNWFSKAVTNTGTFGRSNLAVTSGGFSVSHRTAADEQVPLNNVRVPGSALARTWQHFTFVFDVTNAIWTTYIDSQNPSSLSLGVVGQKLLPIGYLYIAGAPYDMNYWAEFDSTDRAQCHKDLSFSGSMSDFMLFSKILSASEARILGSLNMIRPSTTLRSVTARTDTLSFERSTWIPNSRGSSDNLHLTVKNASADTFLTTFTSPNIVPTLGNSVASVQYSNGSWSGIQLNSHQSGSTADYDPITFKCGQGYTTVFASSTSYSSGAGTDLDIWFSNSADGLTNWNFPQALNSNARSDLADDRNPTVSFRDGAATVVWTSKISDVVTDLLFSRSFDNCQTWSAASRLNNESDWKSIQRTEPRLIRGSKNTLVLFVKKPGSVNQPDAEISIAQTAVDPNFFCVNNPKPDRDVFSSGRFWKRDAAISPGQNGTWVAVYSQLDPQRLVEGSGSGIFVVVKDQSGFWGPERQVLNDSVVNLDYLQVAVSSIVSLSSSIIVAAWIDSKQVTVTSYLQRLRAAVSEDNGLTWAQPQIIYNFTASSNFPERKLSLSNDGTNVFCLAWHVTDATSMLSDVAAARYNHSSKSWGEFEFVNSNAATDSAEDVNPSIVYDRHDQSWLAVWQSSKQTASSDILFASRPHVNFDALCSGRARTAMISGANLTDVPQGLSIATFQQHVVIVWHSRQLVAWDGSTKDGTDSDIFLSYSSDYGKTFSSTLFAIAKPTSDHADDVYPTVVSTGLVSNSNQASFALVWLKRGSSVENYRVFAAALINTTCSPPSLICLGGTNLDLANTTDLSNLSSSFALSPDSLGITSDSGGDVYVCWPDWQSRGANVTVSFTRDRGRTWSTLANSIAAPSLFHVYSTRAFIQYPIIVVACYGSYFDDTQNSADLDVALIRVDFSSLAVDSVSSITNPALNNRLDVGTDYDIQIAANNKTWLVVWSSDDPLSNIPNITPIGDDFDILYSISSDRGMSWSQPSPLNAYASFDNLDDLEPSLSVNSDGVFVVSWITAENIASLKGNDPDILISESADGVHWSAPRAFNQGFELDSNTESRLALGASANTFVSVYTCCSIGNLNFFVTIWSGSLSPTTCPRIDAWSRPSFASAIGAARSSSVDVQPTIATDGSGRVATVYSSTNKVFAISKQISSKIVEWWPLLVSDYDNLIIYNDNLAGYFAAALWKLVYLEKGSYSTQFGWFYTDGISKAKPQKKFPNFGNAAQFYLNAIIRDVPLFPASEFTVSVWISPLSWEYFGAISSLDMMPQILFTKTTIDDTIDFSISFFRPHGSRTVTFIVRYSETETTTFDNAYLPLGQWSHVAVAASRLARSVSLAINGVAVGSSNVRPLVTSSGKISVGGANCSTCVGGKGYYFDSDTTAGFIGYMAHFKLWGTALTLREIVVDGFASVKPQPVVVRSNSDFDILMTTRQSDGSWSAPSLVNSESEGANDTAPAVMATDGSWTAVWGSTGTNQTRRMLVATRPFGATSFSGQRDLSRNLPAENSYFLKHSRSLSMAFNGSVAMAVVAQGTVESELRELPIQSARPSDGSIRCSASAFANPLTLLQSITINTLGASGSFSNFRHPTMLLTASGIIAIFEGYNATATAYQSATFVSSLQSAAGLWATSMLSYTGPVQSVTSSANIVLERSPSVAMNDDGVILLVWSDVSNGQSDIFMLSGLGNSSLGVTFGKTARLLCAQNTNSDLAPVAGVGKFNTFYVVWKSITQSGSTLLMYASSSTADPLLQKTWTDPIMLLSSSAAIGSLSAVYDLDSTIVITISCSAVDGLSTPNDYDLAVIRTTNGGSSWESAQPLRTRGKSESILSDHSEVKHTGDYYVTVWSSDINLRSMIGNDRDILFSRSTDGLTWSDPLPVNSDAMDDVFIDRAPDVCCDKNFCIVVWSRFDPRSKESDIFLSDSTDSGATWSDARFLANSFLSDAANDSLPSCFVSKGEWGVSFVSGTTVAASFFSGRSFFRGSFTNSRLSDAPATAQLSAFGQKFIITAGSDSQREGLYEYTLTNTATSNSSLSGTLSIRFSNPTSETMIIGSVQTQGPRIATGFDLPVVNFTERWDYGASMYSYIDIKTRFGFLGQMFLVYGGKTVSGVTSSAAVYLPTSGHWEELVCGYGTSLPRMHGHKMFAVMNNGFTGVVVYGTPLDLSTSPRALVYTIFGISNVPDSPLFLRAAAACLEVSATGTAPLWNADQQVVLFNTYMLVIDSSNGAHQNEIAYLDLLNFKWGTVPGIRNPPKTSGAFGTLIQNSGIFVLSAVEDAVGLKYIDFNRINAKFTTASSPFGNYLSAFSVGERAVVDISPLTSFGAQVSSSSELSVLLVNTQTRKQTRGIYLNSPSLGTFRFTFSASIPGSYLLHVLSNEEEISGSPFSVEVSTGASTVQTSAVDTSGLSAVRANALQTFAIYTRDAFSNDVLGGDDVSVFISQGNSTYVADVTDNQDGSYKCAFLVTKAGVYLVAANLNSQPLSGSPFSFSVQPGAVDGSLSKVSDVANLKEAPSGQGKLITVRAIDSSGNSLQKGLGKSAVQIVFYNLSQPAAGRRNSIPFHPVNSDSIPTLVTDKGDGTYTIAYLPFVSGDFMFTISINNVSVPGSPFKLRTYPLVILPDSDRSMRFLTITIVLTAFIGACFNPSIIKWVIKRLRRRKPVTISNSTCIAQNGVTRLLSTPVDISNFVSELGFIADSPNKSLDSSTPLSFVHVSPANQSENFASMNHMYEFTEVSSQKYTYVTPHLEESSAFNIPTSSPAGTLMLI